jgi:predicted transcriptional regulator of viral defense system
MANAFDETREMGGLRRTHPADAAIADLAARQHGVVARAQLRRLGLGPDAIDHRLAQGRLQRVHRGVYAVGHRLLSREGAWMTAVLAAGDGAVLSHRSAAALWGIRPAASTRVELTVPRPRRARRRVRLHAAALAADETGRQRGIPVTTPARTLLDIAAVLTPHELERAIEAAESRGLGSPTTLATLVDRYPRRPGVPALRAIVERNAVGDSITRSVLEDRFLAVLDAHGLPRPLVNAAIRLGTGRTIEVDCL